MSGSHHRADEGSHRTHELEAPLIGMSEVGRTARIEERGGVVTGSTETQPVGAALPRYRAASDAVSPSSSTASFGHRVEKILFVAEQEAAETRRNATRESTALIERARAETEALRHEAEQAVLAYRDEVDRLADRRAAELDERERRIERQYESARTDAERQLDEARREADRILSEALGHADAVRAEVDRELDERRAEAERQMGWLEESRRAARDLAYMLLAQTGEDDESAPPLTPHREEVGGGHGVVGSDTVVADVPEPAGGDAPVEVAGTGTPQWHSPCVALPPELRFAGSIGGVSVLDPDPSDDVVEPVRSRQRSAGPAERDWFGYGDTTERLHAVRSPYPDPDASRPGAGRTA